MSETTDKPRVRRPREKVIAWEANTRRVRWIVHRLTLSVEFWVTIYDCEELRHLSDRQVTIEGVGDDLFCCAGGIEVHRREPGPWDSRSKPSHEFCGTLCAPCWHDGTSMGAADFFETWWGTDAQAFAHLDWWATNSEADATASGS